MGPKVVMIITQQPNISVSDTGQEYDANSNPETLTYYLNDLVQKKSFSQAVDVLIGHMDRFGIDDHLLMLANKIYNFLNPLLDRKPDFFTCRMDVVKLLAAVRNFKTAAAVLEEAADHHPGIALESQRRWLSQRWQPFLGPRRYIHPRYTIEKFFEALNQARIRYVVLRWFESLPHIDPDEDIDFLVHDEDMDAFNALLVPYGYNNAQKIDIYSVSGKQGAAIPNVLPYYQSNLAYDILANRICYKGKYFVPSPQDHFFSLAYHVVYHKAEKSGLPYGSGDINNRPAEHDYAETLRALNRQNESPLSEFTFIGIHHYLRRHGWSPTIDLIRKYATERPGWLTSLYPRAEVQYGQSGALTVFVLRERGLQARLFTPLCKILIENGFEILDQSLLSAETKNKATLLLRGGNWSQGPFPTSGGPPAAAIVAYDPCAMAPSDEVKAQYPFVANMRAIIIKEQVRNMANEHLPSHQQYNPLHSCDDDTEAWEYIDTLFKEVKGVIQDRLKILNSLNHDDYSPLSE